MIYVKQNWRAPHEPKTRVAFMEHIEDAVEELALATLATKADGKIGVSAGTMALPSMSFEDEPDCGFYQLGINQIGITMGGVIVGYFYTDGIYADAFFPRVEPITEGAATVSAVTTGDGKDFTTTLTLTDFIIGAIPAANAALAVGNKLFSYPAGVHIEAVYYSSLSLKLPGTANAASVVGIGSVIGSTAVAVLNGTATFMDRSTEVTTPTAAAGGAVTKALAKVTAGVYTGIGLNAATSVKDVFLNAAGTWVVNNAGNLTATGTVVVKWTWLA